MTLTKKDLSIALQAQKKEIKEDIETAIAQVISAVIKHTASKEDIGKVEDRLGKVEGRLGKVEGRLGRVEIEVKDVKRSINDLKADLPTPQEFAAHDKRISKLESAVFPS